MKRPLQLSLAIALALGATHAFALGLGTIRVNSGLNQPLDAEIPIIQSAPGEAEGLIIQLASDEDFDRVGMSRSSIGVPVQFSMGKDSRGEPVVRITTKDAVSEPFLGLLLEANWPKGRLLREYTVLLDPPVMAPAIKGSSAVAVAAKEPERAATQPLPPSKPSPSPTAPAKPAPAPASTAKATPAPAKPAAAAKPSAPASSATEYGPVAAGETLGEIARATRPGEEVSINQMMLALLKNNPDAFFEDNINALKRGAVLRIPSAADVAKGESAREAAATVRAQIDEWRGNSRQSRTPTLVADTTPVASSRPAGSAPTRATGNDERLALVPPREGKASQAAGDRVGGGSAGDSGSAAAKAELARVREALTSKEQEASELKSRLTDLEDIKTKNDKLISLQNSELAELRNKLKQLQDAEAKAKSDAVTAATKATAPVTSKSASETPASATIATATPAAAPTKSDAAPAASSEPKITKDDIWGDTAADGANSATDTKAAAATTPGEPAKATTSTEAPASPTNATAAPAPTADSTSPAAAQPTAKPPVKADAAKPAVSKPAVKPTPAPASDTPWYLQTWVLGAAAGGGLLLVLLGLLGLRKRKPVPTARPSIANTFGDSPVSPQSVQETFGEEEQDLIDQVRADPTNAGAHLELVSFYYAQGDGGRFEAAAEEMYAYIADPNEAHWREVRAMGEELVPHNPLFSNQGMLSDAQESADTFQFDSSNYDENSELPDFADETPGFAAEVERGSASLQTASMPEFDASAFDVGDISVPTADTRASTPAPSADTSFGFDLPSFEERPVSEPQEKQPVASAIEATDDEFFAGEDAIGTKLDLAKAYLDMGDPEGARAMLEEVLTEGAPAQQEEARKLIADIG